MSLKRIALLGSTGTIGINTLKVIDRYPDRFQVVALTAYQNYRRLEEQIRKYAPPYVAVHPKGRDHFRKCYDFRKIRFFEAPRELSQIVALPAVDIVVLGISGSVALEPFLRAVQGGKIIAAANKEALVIAGDILMREARKHRALIIPVDSEQSAIFQCLNGRPRNGLKKIYLTASGGPLHNVSKSTFGRLSVKEILRHPRWKMGKKITVDSATLMNKGFEVMEAKVLFGLPVKDIQVLIHPEAIVHSMVEFRDGSILAQLGITDMRLPIQYALTYPERLDTGLSRMDFSTLKQLTFQKPDFKKFPALDLSFYVAEKGGTLPGVLNAADEEAVLWFLRGRLTFINIYRVVEKVVVRHKIVKQPSLEQIREADRWAREEAQRAMAIFERV
jgi:1-deoxy-D-xylulose-5-phosphate reductoisomerase